MQVIAILKMSNGNESVGEMWDETRCFSENDTLLTVLQWAARRHSRSQSGPETFKGNLTIAVDQGGCEESKS